MTDQNDEIVIVDGHVHIYDCFDLQSLLDCAYENFRRQIQTRKPPVSFEGVLMLAETSKEHWFERLRTACGDAQKDRRFQGPWSIIASIENCSVRAVRETGESLVIVAGRQVITSEGLEVLGLASTGFFEDGIPFSDALAAVREDDAIPVVPWAVGKWLGKRGGIVLEALESNSGNRLFLGDNGGRPVFWYNPRHFRHARRLGLSILPGSDPLPFREEAGRVGSFGFIMNGALPLDRPAAYLKKMLYDESTKIVAYGRLQGPWQFVSNQIRLRMG